MLLEDSELLQYYIWGFTDALEGIIPTSFKDAVVNKAYNLGREIGTNTDDINALDKYTNAEVLRMIKSN